MEDSLEVAKEILGELFLYSDCRLLRCSSRWLVLLPHCFARFLRRCALAALPPPPREREWSGNGEAQAREGLRARGGGGGSTGRSNGG